MALLWIDTSVARSVTDLRLLARLAREKQVTVVVHPQVYLERRRQVQVQFMEEGTSFLPAVFDDFWESLGIQIFEMRLSRPTAAAWADILFARYPTHAAWETAKKDTLGGRLRKGFAVEPGQMPMTTDWLVALEVEHDPDSFVITADTGEEWKALRAAQPPRAFSFREALEWLQQLPA